MTLIEVLVASVLLGVGVAGLISAATLGLRNQQRSAQRVAALYVAQERLAQVELVGPHIWMLGHPTNGTTVRGRVAYDWTIRIEQQLAGELFAVHVEVRWFAPGGEGAVEIETWLNDYEAQALPTVEQPGQTSPEPGPAPPGG